MTSTLILRIKVESATVKVSEGGQHDDKADMENRAVVKLVCSGYNVVERVSGYVREHIDNCNKETKEAAEDKVIEE